MNASLGRRGMAACSTIAVVVLALASGCSGGGAAVSTPPSEPPAPSTTAPATTLNPRASLPAAPASLRLPSLRLSADVRDVGTKDRVLEIPDEPWVAGWWRDGARPGGGRGTVVLTAHLDSRRYGTGPFAAVTRLAPGDALVMRDASGQDTRYEVAQVSTYRKTALPYAELFRQSGPERVVFVTCGGTYDSNAGGWDSNVVVEFTPV